MHLLTMNFSKWTFCTMSILRHFKVFLHEKPYNMSDRVHNMLCLPASSLDQTNVKTEQAGEAHKYLKLCILTLVSDVRRKGRYFLYYQERTNPLRGMAHAYNNIVISYQLSHCRLPSVQGSPEIVSMGQAPLWLGKPNRVCAVAICHSTNHISEKNKINSGERLQQNYSLKMC